MFGSEVSALHIILLLSSSLESGGKKKKKESKCNTNFSMIQ